MSRLLCPAMRAIASLSGVEWGPTDVASIRTP